jgi:hypothetical protein
MTYSVSQDRIVSLGDGRGVATSSDGEILILHPIVKCSENIVEDGKTLLQTQRVDVYNGSALARVVVFHFWFDRTVKSSSITEKVISG